MSSFIFLSPGGRQIIEQIINNRIDTMNNWFECKVKYDKIDEQTGKEKSVTEPYLVDALSFTEAEERIHKEMEAYISGEFTVNGIKKEKLADVFPYESADKWYKCKVVYVDIDEKSGKEKKSGYQMLIMANTLQQACENLEKSLTGVIVPWELKSVAESPILDIFPYEGKE
jgi:hypothetical protein